MENILELCLLGFLIFTKASYGQEDCHCPTVVYLELGAKGKIPCQCDHFDLVSWYRSKEVYDAGGIPFIKYDNSEITGTGKDSGQFDLEENGSLIINNVSIINHEMKYFYVFLIYTEGQTVMHTVKVEVIVPPDPLYPVLNGHMNHQHLYLDMKRQGSLSCSMERVHPKVNLSITVIDQSQQGGIYLERDDTTYSRNEDNTYDVKVTYNYTADLSVQTSILQCSVTGELGQHFSEVTTAEINFPPAFPVIDGGIDPEHIYLKKNRTGEIECSIRSSDPETRLVWRVIDPFSADKIIFHNCSARAMLLIGDTFVIVYIKCNYVVEDEDVDRVTVQCQVADSTDEQYQNAAKVELLFPKKAQSLPAPTSQTPVIDGCDGTHDICKLKVQSEGELTCRVKNTHHLVELRWNIIDGHQWQVSSGKMEVAGDFITTSFQYEVKTSQEILIAECYTVVGDRISEASSKVVLVTEGDGDSDNMSQHDAHVVLSWLTIFVVIFFGLLGIILWYCNRKMYKGSVMKHKNNTLLCDIPGSVYFEKEDAEQDKRSGSRDSGNSGTASRVGNGSEAL